MADTQPDASASADAGAAKGKAPKSGGGFAAWLPLLLTIVAMPALAFATTKYLIIPQIQRATGQSAPATGDHGKAEAGGDHGHGGHGASGGGAKGKHSVALSKMIVNVAGTMGTRYLLTSLTLVGGAADIKTKVEEHRDQLLDVATSTLSNKTIAELEKPGARNQIRGELLTVFNSVLGDNSVNEIFITEFAIQ